MKDYKRVVIAVGVGLAALLLVLLALDAVGGGEVVSLGRGRQRFGHIIATKISVQGGGIDMLGNCIDLDDANTTSVCADTDNQIDFEANGADQVRIVDGVFRPASDNDVDLGTSTVEFKNAYLDGTMTTDVLDVDETANVDGAVTFNSTLDVDGNISSGTGAVTVTDSINITGTVDALADVDVGTWINLSAQSTIALSADGTITPTGTYQVITSTAWVTTSTTTAIANGGETGDLLIIRNGNAANNITIDGTGANVECKADVVLGASDVMVLIWNGSDWNCIAVRDNS
jgi:hypothetical protein